MSNKFTVIRGGLLDSVHTSRREFAEAFITNTRLMGVLAIYAHFRLPENEVMTDIHQFFYIDIEEHGFEEYKVVKNGDMVMVKEIENSLMGGLGGDNIPLSEREVAYLLQKYTAYNLSHGKPMPEGQDEYEFLLNMPADLSDEEISALNTKQCVEIDSDYEAVHYFLMRCMGKDFEGAALLAEPGLTLELFPEFKAGTFSKNVIRRGENRSIFISESVVEIAGSYHLIVTEIILKERRIASYERISAFKISPSEAALMLARPEYISVYDIPEGTKPFAKDSTELTKRASRVKYPAGDLYMIYHPNNKHVAKQEYRLNEDVLGTYYVLGNHQLVATAYTLEEIRVLEYNLKVSEDCSNMTAIARYQFNEPIILEFIQCELDDFEEFVNLLRSFED